MNVTDTSVSLLTHSANETTELAASIASCCKPGDCVLLSGDLGAGKTAFARGFIESLCPGVQVTSPTFTLVQTYDTSTCAIWHFDLYRLDKADDIYETGIEDALRDGISLIEWPEIIRHLHPLDALNIKIVYGNNENERLVSISSPSARWQPLFEVLEKHVSIT